MFFASPQTKKNYSLPRPKNMSVYTCLLVFRNKLIVKNIYMSQWRTQIFLQRVSIACYAERCISYSKSVRLSVRLSVCPSVRHTLALSQNDSSYDHGVFTGG